MTHQCVEGTNSCTCPFHGPMWYHAPSQRHACTEPECDYDKWANLNTEPIVWDKAAAKLMDLGHDVQTVETGGYL